MKQVRKGSVKHLDRKLLARIRAAYQKGDGTIQELADRFGVNRFTLRNRSVKERWSAGRTEVEQNFDRVFEVAVKRKAETMAERAAALVEQQLAEGAGWLDTLREMKSSLVAGDADGCLKLINGWVRIIETQRNAFGLDRDEKQQPLIQLNCALSEIPRKQPAIEMRATVAPEPPAAEPVEVPTTTVSPAESLPPSA